MKAVTHSMIYALERNKESKSGNTVVKRYGNEMRVYLFGNLIAKKNIETSIVQISNCGFETATTKDRLNAIIDTFSNCFDRIYQRDFTWYVENESGECRFPYDRFIAINY